VIDVLLRTNDLRLVSPASIFYVLLLFPLCFFLFLISVQSAFISVHQRFRSSSSFDQRLVALCAGDRSHIRHDRYSPAIAAVFPQRFWLPKRHMLPKRVLPFS